MIYTLFLFIISIIITRTVFYFIDKKIEKERKSYGL